MTERLDRIEALVERNATGIDDLLGAIAQTDRQVQDTCARVDKLTEKTEEANQRFETLRLEAQRDREEFRQSWNDVVAQMEKDRAESRAQADADRAENARRFDAQQETIQRLLLAVVDFGRDNNRLRDRIDNLEGAA